MRTSDRTIRNVTCLVIALMISAGLAACGGGGGGSTSPGTSGPATVSVSIASAPSYPDGTTFATSTSSPTTLAPPPDSPTFEHLFVTVTKLALIPSTGEDKSVTDPLDPPIKIDLLHLSEDNVALLLNKFASVPAGEYSKIRVYYDNVVGQVNNDNTLFHPTANSHFDVHFMGGNLVIPVASAPGIRFYSVVINVVGKYHWAGKSGNVLLVPQVFATVDNSSLKYIVSGTAVQVNHSEGTFVVKTFNTFNDNVNAKYVPDTDWFFADGRFVGPFPSLGVSGVDALQNTAIVDVIGTFQNGVLIADNVSITFPDVLRDKKVYLGWNDNTIILRFVGDNVVSVPGGRRDAAYYDNAVDLNYSRIFGAAIDTAIVDNVTITARGYAVTGTPGGIEAYWISIGP